MDALQFEQERLRFAEGERRQRLLSDVSRVLLDYIGPDEIEPLRRIVHLVTAAMGNDWCAFALVQPDGTLKNVAAYHPDPKQRALEERLNRLIPPRRWDAPPLELNALVQKRPILTGEITDEMLRAAVPSEEAFQTVRELGLTSAVVAPMFDGHEPLGRLLLASTGPGRRYSNDDVDFACSLAGRAALAVRNARLVRELASERDRMLTERMEADRRFAELRAVFDWDPNGIALFDSAGLLRMASHRTEEIFGIPLRAMYGQPYDEIYRRKLEQANPQGRPALLARIRRIFADRSSASRDEIELERPKHRWLTRSTVPVRGVSGEYLGRLFVYLDVTEQRELDRQRSDFLTVAAHELRTPLTPLSMYLQSIERRLARGQAVENNLVTKARRQVDRLGGLVEDLLDLSRLESRRLRLGSEDVKVNELVDAVVADFRGQTRNHDIVFHRSPEPLLVKGDHERLEQVLVNLLTNAIKYTPQGGQIVVAVERGDGEVRVSVKDPGIGVPAEEQPMLFQRFFRAANANTRNYSGLGIGLFVSNEIVKRHGGRFEVSSEVGKGSTFCFHLPLARSPAEAHATRGRVLLVDDDPAILDATGQVLREWGYAVDEAGDGESALDLARAAPPDLMLVDLMMPVMDGWTLIQRLREQQVAPGVPVVVFSADREARERARNLAAQAALRKPFELQELQDVVERLIPKKPAA
ncbi:MAG TPA: ATP-binding protein [Myxococcales bacterium]|nr:ATP-binding protein [Myxococcales bacterium]